MKSPLRTTLCLVAAGLVATLAVAEKTRFWRQSNYDEFEKGTAKGVALRSDGKLMLAPRFAQFSDPNAAYLWAVRADSKGTLYAAGGSNAKVVRLDEKGAATTVFESQELAAQALEMDAQDNLYVGTSPDGKVYKVSAKGEKSVFFEPKTKYIWALAFDAAGTLYVATGDKGEIHAVTPDGKGQVYYKSEEMHARALAFDAQGNLVFGSDPNGLVVRLEKSRAPATAPQAFVIYEAARKEITSLLADKSGNLYAAAVGEKPRTTPISPALAAQQAAIAAAAAAAGVPQSQVPQQQFVPFPPTSGGSEVYRITADGAPEVLWTSREELVYALGFSPAGKLLLGTGNKGQLIQLEGHNLFSSLAKTASAQVTGFAAGPGGKLFLSTANPGKVFTVGPDYEPEGSFESQAFDARIFSQWGRLSWWGENGATHGQVSFHVRSGNTSNPEKNWSPWAGPYTDAKGAMTAVPAARFVQWKAVFRAPSGTQAAKGISAESLNISWVNLAYLPKNLAPVVDSIIVQNPGVRVQGFQGQPGSGPQTAPLRLPQPASPGQPSASSQPAQPPRFDAPPQGFVQRGMRGVVWGTKDENDDELEYALYYRGEGEKNWKLLKDKIEQKFHSWDTGAMPDGAYYLKVVASDAPSNPAGEALTADRESDRFEVDNTPPAVAGLRAEPMSPEVKAQFEARDNYSNISRAEYSLNAGEWKMVFPVTRTTDAPLENYQIALGTLPAGEHTLAVRVFDQFENSASAKVTFVVEVPKKK